MVSWSHAFETTPKVSLVSAGWYVLGLVVAVVLVWVNGPIMLTFLSEPTALITALRSWRSRAKSSS